MMRGLSFRSLTFMLFIAFILCSSNFETCNARRGKHWRHSRGISASLFKKKGKSQGSSNNHHSGGSKPKSPPHKASPLPTPKPKSPPHKASPLPTPKPKSPPHSHKPKAPPLPTPKPKEEFPSNPPAGHSTTFNVLDFGAKGDGSTDDTKAFQAAWAAACKIEASMIVVPAEYEFLVGPISFSGPYCQANIVFQLDGTIIAPTNSNAWGKGLLQWLEFTKLRGITIQGNGIIDGRGSVWWQDAPFDDPIDDEIKLLVPLNSSVEENPPMPVTISLTLYISLGRIMPSIKPTVRTISKLLNSKHIP